MNEAGDQRSGRPRGLFDDRELSALADRLDADSDELDRALRVISISAVARHGQLEKLRREVDDLRNAVRPSLG